MQKNLSEPEGGPNAQPSPEQASYLAAEMAALRSELLNHFKQMEFGESAGLLSSAAIWTWIIGNYDPRLSFLAWLPAVVCVFFFIRHRSLESGVQGIAEYLRRIETTLGLPKSLGLGWENYLTKTRREWLAQKTNGLWLVLIMANVFAAGYIGTILPLKREGASKESPTATVATTNVVGSGGIK